MRVSCTLRLALLLTLLAANGIFAGFLRASSSCDGRCNTALDSSATCQCNTACIRYGDCCADFDALCNSQCAQRCNSDYDAQWACQCNSECAAHNNCCPDSESCGGSGGDITDADLSTLSEQLFSLDVNSGAGAIVFNAQAQTSSGSTTDKASSPLFTSVDESIFQRDTYAKLLALYDNYIADVNVAETLTAAETAEDNAFLDAVLATDVMKTTHQFLADKGKASADLATFRQYLKSIWIDFYSRGAAVGSSGLEHVFLGEMKNGISGFHNWVRYYTEEKAGKMNYLGYINLVPLEDDTVIEMPLKWNGVYKSISSIFIGSSPELDLALLTTCFLARPNSLCRLTSGGKVFHAQTYTLDYNNKVYVGSAYFTV